MQNIPPAYLRIGSIVTTSIRSTLDLATHFAIVSHLVGPDGLPMVIANSPDTGGPAVLSWTQFTQGRPYKNAYYPSTLAPMEVLQNAYLMFDSRYDLLNWNCENFTNACHGLPAVSKQVQTAVALAALGGLALILSRAA